MIYGLWVKFFLYVLFLINKEKLFKIIILFWVNKEFYVLEFFDNFLRKILDVIDLKVYIFVLVIWFFFVF